MDQSPAQPVATAAAPEHPGEDANPTTGDDADLQAHAGFDGALRGYDRRQVNKYVTRAQKRMEELTAQLAEAHRNVEILNARVDELTRSVAMCTCDPNKPESQVVGARLRQIIDIAAAEAGDLRAHAQAESQAMREEADAVLANARQQAEQATAALEAMLAQRRAAEEAAEAERRAAVEGWADRHVTEARDTARRVVERAGSVSSQVIASARWLVDALGAHRDALSEQLGGVQRRIDELPSLELAAAVPGEHLLTALSDIPASAASDIPASAASDEPAAVPAVDQAPVPAAENQPVALPSTANGSDEASQPVRGVVRMPDAYTADGALPAAAPEAAAEAAPPATGVARPPAHAAPAETATLNRTWAPVTPRVGGAHRG